MLVASLALHVSLAMGIALSYFHRSANPVGVSNTAQPSATSVLLLPAEKPPVRAVSPPAPAKPTVQVIAAAAPIPPVLKKAVAAIPESRPLAAELNPNAHIHPLAPDSVLCPNPTPHLNGASGVVFILDISGSMYEPYADSTRLALARQTLSRQIRALKDGTPFAITLYAQRALNSGPLVAASPATREAAIRFIMRDVDCGGGTNLPAGLVAAQQLHTGSLVLATDGDLNSSASDLATAAMGILGAKGQCPALTILGIAPRSTTGDEQILQALADQQGGTYRFEQAGDDAELVTSVSNATKPASATP